MPGIILREQLKEEVQRSNAKTKRVVKAIIFPRNLEKQENIPSPTELDGYSKSLAEDPWSSMVNMGQVIEPPFDLLTLAMLPENSTELNQCIEAMEFNIDGFGHRLIPRIRAHLTEETPKELHDEIVKERTLLQNFFNYCCMEDSFTTFRTKRRRDLETTGCGWFEVIRNSKKEIQGFSHLPSYQMRLGCLDTEPIETEVSIHELQTDGSIEIKKITTWKRFRKHVQSKSVYTRGMLATASFNVRWFKDFGDERVMDNETGEWLTPEQAAKIPESRKANEVIYQRIYCPRSPYGLPRFIGNLLSIFGDRASEEINYRTFRSNNIPSLALMVSNGQLTEGTIKRIESFVESQIQGSDNYSKFLIVEGESASVEGEDAGQVKIDIKPLTKEQHSDELFQNYSRNNQDKIRRAFRLPPILVGRADDYTRATADSSRRLADEQIFAPERDEFDNLINRIIFPVMGVKYHRFKSNSPNTTDNAELISMLSSAERTGSMTPRIARIVMEDVLGFELPEFPADFPQDVPFSLTMAEAVKNQAIPTEVGQQVTALKTIESLVSGNYSPLGWDDQKFVDQMLRVRENIEKSWRKEAVPSPQKHDH